MDKMLITKIKRTDETRADLFGKGHKWPDLKLFDIGELLAVGIAPDDLPIGVEKPCRFLAHYTLSEKLNAGGNPYKDVSHLEPIDNGNRTTAPPAMNDAMLAAILKELQTQTELLQALVGTVAGSPERPEPGPQEPPPEEEPEDSTLDQWFSEETPTSPQALLEIVEYSSVRVLYDALADHFGDDWKGWPPASDVDAWSNLVKTALQLAAE